MVNYYNYESTAGVGGTGDGTMGKKRLTACEVESLELSDYEQLAAILLEGQVTKPLEDHWHLLGTSVEKEQKRKL